MKKSYLEYQGDNIYYNMVIENDTLDYIPAQFFETRSEPILQKANDYHMSVIRFSIPTSSIPIFSFPMAIYNQGTISQSGNTVTLVGGFFTSNMVNNGAIIYPDGNSALITGFISNTQVTVNQSLTELSTHYTLLWNNTLSISLTYQGVQFHRFLNFYSIIYDPINQGLANIWSIQQFIQIINNTWQLCFNDMMSYSWGSTSLPDVSKPPYLVYNPTTELVSLFCQNGYQDLMSRPVQMWLNLSVFSYFPNLPAYANTSAYLKFPSRVGLDQRIIINNQYANISPNSDNNNNNLYYYTYSTGTASQSGNIITGIGTTFTSDMIGGVILFADGNQSLITGYTGATSLTGLQSILVTNQSYVIYYGVLQITQDFPTASAWYNGKSLQFLTGQIPIRNELIPGQNNNNLQLMTDYDLSSVQSTISDPYLQVFHQTGPYRWIDLLPNSNLTRVDLTIAYSTNVIDNTILYIAPGETATIKLLFRKKTSFLEGK
jgi:hypothetical protein